MVLVNHPPWVRKCPVPILRLVRGSVLVGLASPERPTRPKVGRGPSAEDGSQSVGSFVHVDGVLCELARVQSVHGDPCRALRGR